MRRVEYVELALFADVIGAAKAGTAAAPASVACAATAALLVLSGKASDGGNWRQKDNPLTLNPNPCPTNLQATDRGQGAGGCGALMAS